MYQGINYGNVSLGCDKPASNALVLAAQDGDRSAFRDLIQDYEAVVLRVALNLTGSPDEAQQIYCRVFRDAFVSVSQLTSGNSVFVWVYRLLVRHCLEYCRRHWQVAGSTGSPGEDFEIRSRIALASLTPTERVIFQLKQSQGLKIRTLAEIFQVTPDFVVENLQHANAHLRRQLQASPRHSLPT